MKNKRRRFVKFLNKKIAKTPDACIFPKWIRIIYYILFPVRSFYQRCNKWCYYNVVTDEFTICGMKFTENDLKRWTYQDTKIIIKS